MKEPFLWFFLGGIGLLVGVASLFGGLLENLTEPFWRHGNRRKLIEEQRENGGQDAVDRFLDSEELHSAARADHRKNALSDAFVGEGERWKFIAFCVVVGVLIVLAVTR